MISQWLSAALARRNIHYGWVTVGVTFLTAVITAGTVGAPGVFIVPLQKEFGWSAAEISSALSIRFILFGLMAPFAAALHNRFGLRNVTLSALVIVASALVISLTMTKLWQLMLLWGVVIGFGTGPHWCWGPPWPRAGSRRDAGWRWVFSPQPWPPANWCSCRCWPV
jgi:cyanate permease